MVSLSQLVAGVWFNYWHQHLSLIELLDKSLLMHVSDLWMKGGSMFFHGFLRVGKGLGKVTCGSNILLIFYKQLCALLQVWLGIS